MVLIALGLLYCKMGRDVKAIDVDVPNAKMDSAISKWATGESEKSLGFHEVVG